MQRNVPTGNAGYACDVIAEALRVADASALQAQNNSCEWLTAASFEKRSEVGVCDWKVDDGDAVLFNANYAFNIWMRHEHVSQDREVVRKR
jgi:hypothetical protein